MLLILPIVGPSTLWTPPLRVRGDAPLAALRSFAADCGGCPLSRYPRDRLCGVSAHKAVLPAGWHINSHECVIGTGREAFERARLALKRFDCLQLGWLSATTAGDTLAICSRQLGCVWLMNANRLLMSSDTGTGTGRGDRIPDRQIPLSPAIHAFGPRRGQATLTAWDGAQHSGTSSQARKSSLFGSTHAVATSASVSSLFRARGTCFRSPPTRMLCCSRGALLATQAAPCGARRSLGLSTSRARATTPRRRPLARFQQSWPERRP